MEASFYIKLKNGVVTAFAGLSDHWQNPNVGVVESFKVITCDSNEIVSQLHNLMPVVISLKDFDTRLNTATQPENAKKVLLPYPAERMTLWKVGPPLTVPRSIRKNALGKFDCDEIVTIVV